MSPEEDLSTDLQEAETSGSLFASDVSSLEVGVMRRIVYPQLFRRATCLREGLARKDGVHCV